MIEFKYEFWTLTQYWAEMLHLNGQWTSGRQQKFTEHIFF